MYAVLLEGRILRTNKRFSTYEKARQFVRKRLTKQVPKEDRNLFWTSNPMIGDYGYSIKKV